MQRLQVRVHQLIRNCKNLVLVWVPSHCGVHGNEATDRAAKEAARALPQPICINYTDWVPIIKRRIYEKWRERWSESLRDLSTIKPSPGRWCRQRPHRKEEVIINRLRLGHTRATHGYLFDSIEARQSPLPMVCIYAALSVRHMLLECVGLVEERRVLLQSRVRGDLSIVKLIGEYSPYEIVLTTRNWNIW